MTKECKKVRELITLFIDNKIDESSKMWFNKHILLCDDCAVELKEIKKAVNVLKFLKQENIPPDFYFKLNKELDKIEAKRKNNVFFPNFQVALRMSIVFAIFIFGFFITLKVVQDSRKFISHDIIEVEQKDEISKMKKIVKKEENLVDVKPKQENFIKRIYEMSISTAHEPVKIEYRKFNVPYNLISTKTERIDYPKIASGVYMQPIPAKSYYELDQKQIHNKFDLKVQNFVIDNHDTWVKFNSKYNINAFGKPDFNSEMMILTAIDDEITNNYSVQIINALKEIDQIVIMYKINLSDNEENIQIKKIDAKIISKTHLPIIFKRIQ